MALRLIKIEHLEGFFRNKVRAGARRWMKNQRNRKIRRINKREKPLINKLYKDYEY
jgi:hypothetical protein